MCQVSSFSIVRSHDKNQKRITLARFPSHTCTSVHSHLELWWAMRYHIIDITVLWLLAKYTTMNSRLTWAWAPDNSFYQTLFRFSSDILESFSKISNPYSQSNPPIKYKPQIQVSKITITPPNAAKWHHTNSPALKVVPSDSSAPHSPSQQCPNWGVRASTPNSPYAPQSPLPDFPCLPSHVHHVHHQD